MDEQEFNSRMRAEVDQYTCNGRQPSAAFLAWFLENYFRLESQDAVDSVCDKTNDKGIDGIYVDDEEEVIYLFQSKFSPNDNQDQGDNDLRNFVGAKQWFNDENSVNALLCSTACQELKSLVNRLNIIERIDFDVILVFVTNKKLNIQASEFLEVNSEYLQGFDITKLYDKYTYFADEEIITPPISLRLSNNTKIEYNLPDGTLAKVYAIRAKELIKLQGIQDRTLFYKNVRYGVGKTRVNKAIQKTILESTEHNNFFLYHNGVTIVCETLEEDRDQLTISNYAVINGCQSMLSFYENRGKLSNNLFVLTKIIKLDPTSPLVKQITYYANNQNSISLKDLRSNDRVQKALQREFFELFDNKVLYRRKKGEFEEDYEEVIEKDFVAQLIEAFYLKKPHNTHLKAKLFGEEYTKIFSRNTSAAKIYLAYVIYGIIEDNANLLDNEKIRNYGLAIFFFTYVIGELLGEDEIGKKIIEEPSEYVTTNLEILKKSIIKFWGLITPDINADIEEYGDDHDSFFDYKNVFKNSQFVKDMHRKIKSDYIRIVRRNEEDSFSNIFKSFQEE